MSCQDNIRKTCDVNIVGYWISQKKKQKFNWPDFEKACSKAGLLLKMIDIDSDIEAQGPFHIFLHKLTDKLALSDIGDKKAKAVISRVEDYLKVHSDIIVIDPLDHVRNLLSRYSYYKMIQEGLQYDDDVFIPKFVQIASKNMVENSSFIKEKGLKFPCVCKPIVAHGSSDSHKMMVIFNEQGLRDCQMPCVIQELINHNAILYKIFVVDSEFHILKRPSLKNFYAEDCETMSTIFFSSHDISKSSSNSKWSIIAEKDINLTIKPSYKILEKIAKKVREIFGLVLFGVDVVIENHTGKYAVIDVNIFPSYDGYPNFFEYLTVVMKRMLFLKKVSTYGNSLTLNTCSSDDLDSGFESDEKKKITKLY